MNKKRVILTFFMVMLIFTSLTSKTYALFGLNYPKREDLQRKIGFLTDGSIEPIQIGKDVLIQIQGLYYGWLYTNNPGEDSKKYYVGREGAPFVSAVTNYFILTANGVSLKIKNVSDNIIIRWRESCISVNEYSGIPFLDGMNYADANTLATPDTLIPPGQTISKTVYLPRLEHNYSYSYFWGVGTENWWVVGEPILRGNSVAFSLMLKVIDCTEKGNYYTINCPPIGVRE